MDTPRDDDRIRVLRDRPVRPGGSWVLYWMVAHRRTRYNASLDRALWWCRELGRPLVVLEALRAGYPWASDRLHVFVVQGMRDQARRLDRAGIVYHPYLEPEPGAGRGLLAALSDSACVLVTDDAPVFFLPRMVAAAARRAPVRVEAVDSSGLLPVRSAPRPYVRAVDFRRHVQRSLARALDAQPRADALRGLRLPALQSLPRRVLERWPAASPGELADPAGLVARLPIDHDVTPVGTRGGERAGRRALVRFLETGLARYADDRQHPDEAVESGLSAYLHFGHVSSHEVLLAVGEAEGWSPLRLGTSARGGREGWWGMGRGAEAFLDQLVTWREIGYSTSALVPEHGTWDALPGWARATLEAHAGDPRPAIYGLDDLEGARTGDGIWNAAQTQLRREGRIHNYLRMLWGKRILEWTRHPREALDVMTRLNDRWALDGRDPNSESGISWVLGLYDRPWPERPVFGKVRYMTSRSARRKLRLRRYLERHATGGLADPSVGSHH